MSNPKSLPSSSSPGFLKGATSATDRYHGEVTDYTDIPHSLDFKEPPNIKPRKSKFYSLYGDSSADTKTGDDKHVYLKQVIFKDPTKEDKNTSSKDLSLKVSGQVLRENYEAKQRYDQAHPHGSIESNTVSEARVKQFDEAKNNRHLAPPTKSSKSVSLPASPNPSPKLTRKFSSNNLIQIASMGVVSHPPMPKDLSIEIPELTVALPDRQVAQRELTVAVAEKPLPPEKTEPKPEISIPPPGALPHNVDYSETAFGNWFKKRLDVKKRDVNAFSPTSY